MNANFKFFNAPQLVGVAMIAAAFGIAPLPAFAAQPKAQTPAPKAQTQPAPAQPATVQQAATDAAKVGDRFGDWVFECAAIGEGQTLCSLTQTLVAKDTNKPIARFSLGRDKKTNEILFGAVIPLGLEIATGVNFAIDQNPPIPLNLLTCTQNGCLASIAVNAKQLDAMKAGKAFSVSFKFRGAENPAILTGSLNGLDAGLSAAGLK